MSQTEPMNPYKREAAYLADRAEMTPRQARRYRHKMNRHFGQHDGATPRRCCSRAERLKRIVSGA